jgi:hypothetical protein
MLVNLGCLPHFKQGGEVGLGRSCFSMPQRILGNACGQVNYWIRNQIGSTAFALLAQHHAVPDRTSSGIACAQQGRL